MTTGRSDHGFTLAETLIALWVVSMAMGCVLAGFAVLSRFDHAAHKEVHTRRAADAAVAALQQAVTTGEGFSVRAFKGDARHLRYACGEGGGGDNFKLCTLNEPGGRRLSYVSETGIHQTWPDAATEMPPQPLEALILQTTTGTTLSVVRIQTEQARDCQFDTISRTCREEPK